ncbi:MAG TPA: hypothetical protein VKU00_22475 [Chthonomonadaceae bacterium]|nr:hypothetical protein [Chthonomonadaceae bacterium]
MTSEKQDPSSEEEGTDASETPVEESAPTLNRAERRAQAKGKKTLPGGQHPSGLQNRGGGPGGRAAFGVNKTRIPRTGHK